MTLRELERRVVQLEQLALETTLVNDDRLREMEVRLLWNEAKKVQDKLQAHGVNSRVLLGRLGSVMVDLLCADERIRISSGIRSA